LGVITTCQKINDSDWKRPDLGPIQRGILADDIGCMVGGLLGGMKVYPVAAWLARQTPGLRIVAQLPDAPQPLGIGFNKNSPLLVAKVNGVLSEIK